MSDGNGSRSSSVGVVSTADDKRPTVSPTSQTSRPPTTSSLASSHRHSAGSPSSQSSLSSHSRCSCSHRVTHIRAVSGSHSDGDLDDSVTVATRRSLRSTASEGGAFRRVLPSRDCGEHGDWSVKATTKGRDWLPGAYLPLHFASYLHTV